jgi:hypothetical protein
MIGILAAATDDDRASALFILVIYLSTDTN